MKAWTVALGLDQLALLVKTELEEAVSAIACCGFTTGSEGLALRVE